MPGFYIYAEKTINNNNNQQMKSIKFYSATYITVYGKTFEWENFCS